MNVAIIDIGSNNIKLEIFDVDPMGSARLLMAEKVNARLGHGAFITHKLNEDNAQKAIVGLTQFAQIIKSQNCKTTIALGTAALRESQCKEFLKKVQKESGIQISVISGLEEARLVYAGVLANHPFKGRTFFLNDIGGGSTEISVANEKVIYYVDSFRLGTVRLKEMFPSDIDGDRASAEMIRRYVEKVIEPEIPEIRKYSIDMGLSTGGTAKNLAEMAAARNNGPVYEDGMIVLNTNDLQSLIDDLLRLSTKEREKVKGLDLARSDIILPGGILLLSILRKLGIEKSLISGKGLRDGALYDFISKKVNKKIFNERQGQIRLHGLRSASEKYNVDKIHAENCAQLSLQLFDLLMEVHNLDEEYRDILYGAALLHDAGRIIDFSQHHKHSFYIINNTNLLGFSNKERMIIALVARYHRKGMPKNSHTEYMSLHRSEQSAVLKMAALLRLADAISKGYKKLVKKVELLAVDRSRIVIGLKGKGDMSLELWTFERKKEFAEKVYGRTFIAKRI